MAEDKNRLARFGAAQGGLAAYRKYGEPVIRPLVQRGRDALAYARIAGTPALADTMAQVAARSAGQAASDVGLRGSLAIAEKFGQSAARGMVNRGFDGLLRYGTEEALLETPAAGRTATYLSKLHRPPILRRPAAGTRTAKVVDWVGRQGAKVQDAAVKTAGSMSTGITSGAVSGAAKGLAKQMFSKAGLTAGFAMSAVMDAGEAIRDFANNESISLADMGADEWRKVRAAFLPRLGQGVLRGLDGALFGLPSLIPWYSELAGGDEYMTGEYSKSGSARDFYMNALKRAGGPDNMSAADWAKISAEYEQRREDAYVNGIDERGFREPGVTKAELDRRSNEVKFMRDRRKAVAGWREAMLYNFDSTSHPEGPDVQTLRGAVFTLLARHRQRMADVERVYGDNDTFVNEFTRKTQSGQYLPKGAVGFRDTVEVNPNTRERGNLLDELVRRGDTAGLTSFREEKRGIAELGVLKDLDREFSRISQFRGFDALVDAARQDALALYTRAARARGYTKEESAQDFAGWWSGLSDYQKVTLEPRKLVGGLLANPTTGQEEPR